MIPYRSELNTLHDYVPGKSIEEIREKHGLQDVVKLASNENPLGPSPLAMKAFAEHVRDLHLYPRGECPQLRSSLSRTLGIPEAQIVLGNGSDEILALIGMAYLEKGTSALTCAPTFSVYGSVAQAMGADFITIPLKDYCFDLDGLLAQAKGNTRVIFICNPNNPTGTYVKAGDFERFMQKVSPETLVVVDQAYCEFADQADYPDLVANLGKYPNLLLTRTFSKVWGLAGLRVGYALGAPDVIAKLWKVKPPFNINLPGQFAAAAALDDQRHLDATRSCNHDGKIQLLAGLKEFGFRVLPTQANFFAVEVGPRCPELVLWLESQGMIVRSLKSFGMPAWFRVTVGLPSENAKLLQLLETAKREGRLT